MARKKYYKLTNPQKNILYLQLYTLDVASIRNILNWFFLVKGDCNTLNLEKAFNRLIYENDTFRLQFKSGITGIRQYVKDYEYEKLEHIKVENWDACKSLMEECQRKTTIDIKNDTKQYKAKIITYDKGSILFMQVSHYCIDGYSIGLAAKKLCEYYEAYEKNENLPEPDDSLSIINFIESNQEYQKSKRHKKAKEYWNKAFKMRKDFSIPIRRRKLRSGAGVISINISGDKYSSIESLGKKLMIPTYFIIMACIAYSIHDITGKTSFDIASITDARNTHSLRQAMGCMYNVFVHFYNIQPGINRLEYIKSNYMDYLTAFRYGTITALECFWQSPLSAIKNIDFNYYGMMVTALDFEEHNVDKTKYEFEVLAYSYLANQLYCSIEDNHKNNVRVNLVYQDKLFNDREIENAKDVFMKNINGILDESNKELQEG